MRKAQLVRRLEDAERAAAEATRETAATRREIVRLRQALDAVGDGVAVCDETGAVVFRNGHAADPDARHEEALVARAVEQTLAAAATDEAASQLVELHGPAAPQTLTVRAQALREEDELVGYVAVVRDVSERHQLDAMRRDFVVNMGHELRTPVGGIGVLADALTEQDDPAVVARLAGRLQAEAHRLARLIEDLLDLGRVEAEPIAMVERVAVEDVIREAVERVAALAEKRGVDIVVTVAQPNLAVRGAARQLVSAVSNLIENGVRYSDQSSRVEVTVRADGDAVEVVVEDHGIGIPAKDLSRIFERFYRVDRARSRQTGGTGLGLAIVRHVAANHGGDVAVVSREGEGSTFTLRLPAEPS